MSLLRGNIKFSILEPWQERVEIDGMRIQQQLWIPVTSDSFVDYPVNFRHLKNSEGDLAKLLQFFMSCVTPVKNLGEPKNSYQMTCKIYDENEEQDTAEDHITMRRRMFQKKNDDEQEDENDIGESTDPLDHVNVDNVTSRDYTKTQRIYKALIIMQYIGRKFNDSDPFNRNKELNPVDMYGPDNFVGIIFGIVICSPHFTIPDLFVAQIRENRNMTSNALVHRYTSGIMANTNMERLNNSEEPQDIPIEKSTASFSPHRVSRTSSDTSMSDGNTNHSSLTIDLDDTSNHSNTSQIIQTESMGLQEVLGLSSYNDNSRAFHPPSTRGRGKGKSAPRGYGSGPKTSSTYNQTMQQKEDDALFDVKNESVAYKKLVSMKQLVSILYKIGTKKEYKFMYQQSSDDVYIYKCLSDKDSELCLEKYTTFKHALKILEQHEHDKFSSKSKHHISNGNLDTFCPRMYQEESYFQKIPSCNLSKDQVFTVLNGEANVFKPPDMVKMYVLPPSEVEPSEFWYKGFPWFPQKIEDFILPLFEKYLKLDYEILLKIWKAEHGKDYELFDESSLAMYREPNTNETISAPDIWYMAKECKKLSIFFKGIIKQFKIPRATEIKTKRELEKIFGIFVDSCLSKEACITTGVAHLNTFMESRKTPYFIFPTFFKRSYNNITSFIGNWIASIPKYLSKMLDAPIGTRQLFYIYLADIFIAFSVDVFGQYCIHIITEGLPGIGKSELIGPISACLTIPNTVVIYTSGSAKGFMDVGKENAKTGDIRTVIDEISQLLLNVKEGPAILSMLTSIIQRRASNERTKNGIEKMIISFVAAKAWSGATNPVKKTEQMNQRFHPVKIAADKYDELRGAINRKTKDNFPVAYNKVISEFQNLHALSFLAAKHMAGGSIPKPCIDLFLSYLEITRKIIQDQYINITLRSDNNIINYCRVLTVIRAIGLIFNEQTVKYTPNAKNHKKHFETAFLRNIAQYLVTPPDIAIYCITQSLATAYDSITYDAMMWITETYGGYYFTSIHYDPNEKYWVDQQQTPVTKIPSPSSRPSRSSGSSITKTKKRTADTVFNTQQQYASKRFKTGSSEDPDIIMVPSSPPKTIQNKNNSIPLHTQRSQPHKQTIQSQIVITPAMLRNTQCPTVKHTNRTQSVVGTELDYKTTWEILQKELASYTNYDLEHEEISTSNKTQKHSRKNETLDELKKIEVCKNFIKHGSYPPGVNVFDYKDERDKKKLGNTLGAYKNPNYIKIIGSTDNLSGYYISSRNTTSDKPTICSGLEKLTKLSMRVRRLPNIQKEKETYLKQKIETYRDYLRRDPTFNYDILPVLIKTKDSVNILVEYLYTNLKIIAGKVLSSLQHKYTRPQNIVTDIPNKITNRVSKIWRTVPNPAVTLIVPEFKYFSDLDAKIIGDDDFCDDVPITEPSYPVTEEDELFFMRPYFNEHGLPNVEKCTSAYLEKCVDDDLKEQINSGEIENKLVSYPQALLDEFEKEQRHKLACCRQEEKVDAHVSVFHDIFMHAKGIHDQG